MTRPTRILVFAGGALVCAGSFLFDDSVIGWVAAHPSHGVKRVSQFFSHWGDFIPIVAFLAALLIVGSLLKRPFFTRVVLLMLGSAVAGGLVANILRLLTGRARPGAKVPAGWYGLRHHGVWIAGSYRYSSFPSAHTAVAIACVVPLWLLLPARWRVAVALPATLAALCVAASRILLNAHHLSDVLTSVWLGIVVSALVCGRFAGKKPAQIGVGVTSKVDR